MDDSTTVVLSIGIILLTLVVTAFFSRRSGLPLRPIGAYAILPRLIGQSIEADRPIHLSLGSAGIGGENTLLTLASAEMAYWIIRDAAIGDTSPLFSVTNASALPFAQDTLRRAFYSRELGRGYHARSARWYPSGSRSLAFAAAITAMMGDENVSSNVMLGSYGPELALILNASMRRSLPSIAVSDQLEGQAVAYALADEPLIGEEIFYSASYLAGDRLRTPEPLTADVLRWIVIAAMFIGLVMAIAEGA